MKKRLLFVCALAFLVSSLMVCTESAAADSSFGIGVNYFLPLKFISDEGFDSDFLSYLLTFRKGIGTAFSWEVMLDYFPGSDFSGLDMGMVPTLSLIWGRTLNLGLGIGKTYWKESGESGEWGDSILLLQGGANLPLGEAAALNLSLFGYLDKLGDISDLGTDNITIAVRFFFKF